MQSTHFSYALFYIFLCTLYAPSLFGVCALRTLHTCDALSTHFFRTFLLGALYPVCALLRLCALCSAHFLCTFYAPFTHFAHTLAHHSLHILCTSRPLRALSMRILHTFHALFMHLVHFALYTPWVQPALVVKQPEMAKKSMATPHSLLPQRQLHRPAQTKTGDGYMQTYMTSVRTLCALHTLRTTLCGLYALCAHFLGTFWRIIQKKIEQLIGIIGVVHLKFGYPTRLSIIHSDYQ